MNDTFLSYIPGDSLIHRLDPRTKIISVMAISILIFRTQHLYEVGIFALFFIFLSLISGVSILVHIRGIRPLAIFFGFIFLMQLFLTEGRTLFSLGPLQPSLEGLLQGTFIVTRFMLLILFASILTSTTRPTMITGGIERMLRPFPLRLLGITSFELATMMSLSIRFIPLILENSRQIRNAQMSRGLDIKHDLRRGVSSISVPLIMGSIRAAEELATAMESRCYQGNYRTSLFELKMKGMDWAILTVVILSTLVLLP